MKKCDKVRISINRLYIALPVAVLSLVILVLSLSLLFMSQAMMTSKLFGIPGPLMNFAQSQSYTIITFCLVAVSSISLGIATVWIRYRAIIILY